VYRLNTYPFIHTGFFHALFNALAVAPLLERFESEHGTLTAVALFVGRECLGDVIMRSMC
jgi:glycosylphosphatidylinositol transamidase